MLTGRRAFDGDDISDHARAACCRDEPRLDGAAGRSVPRLRVAAAAALPREGPQAPIERDGRRAARTGRRRRIGRSDGVVSPPRRFPGRPLRRPRSNDVHSGGAPSLSPPRPSSRARSSAQPRGRSNRHPWRRRSCHAFRVPLGEGQTVLCQQLQSVAISPDGTRFVYVANNQLYLRSLSNLEARPIQGTLT